MLTAVTIATVLMATAIITTAIAALVWTLARPSGHHAGGRRTSLAQRHYQPEHAKPTPITHASAELPTFTTEGTS